MITHLCAYGRFYQVILIVLALADLTFDSTIDTVIL